MKKSIAALAVVLVLAVLTALPASAANRMTLRVGDVSAPLRAGEMIRVPVEATANTGYVSALLTVFWDSRALELCEVEFSDLAPDQGSSAPDHSGVLTLRIGRSTRRENETGTGMFFTLVFRIVDGATAGDYTVSLGDRGVLDTELNYVAFTAISGTVSLIAEGEEPTQGAAATDLPPAAGDESAGASDQPTAAPTSASAAAPTAAAVTVKPPAAEPTEVLEPVVAEPDEEGGYTVPWLTIIAVIGTVAVAGVVALRQKKKADNH